MGDWSEMTADERAGVLARWAQQETANAGLALGAAQEAETLRQAVAAIWDACPNYGSEGCVCGPHATPDKGCPVHWAVAVLERHGLDYRP